MFLSMKDFLLLNKQVGETPLACMDRFRVEHPEYQGVKMTYAGRLDPMASGLLLVLTGDAVHKKDEYLTLRKTYTCTALLGVETDTYDVLGLPLLGGLVPDRKGTVEALNSFIGTFEQTYPPYSSKTVNGKQLHQIARSGDINQVVLPTHRVTVERIFDVSEAAVSLRETAAEIQTGIQSVSGDFRQLQIINEWKKIENTYPQIQITAISFSISVSKGTYIRGIVHELGKKLGCGACILKLHRTKVGEYEL